jgi:hypothetical protein
MSHNVFANSNEICAKSSSGSSTLAADTCFSPGAPPPGVPILYMSTGKASDLTKGSKTVLIQGAEVCMQDKSYFSTNYGDEPATKALKRGFVSTAVQGKCYFIGWSPNVSVQGKAVTRHMDMMTHNHSNPGNTPPMPFISSLDPAVDNSCEADKKKIEDHCAAKTTDKGEMAAKKAEGQKKAGERKNGKPVVAAKNISDWVVDHCDGMFDTPTTTSARAIKKAAMASECAKARRCALIAFSKSTKESSWRGTGCCPGQTGHHILPDAMFRDPDKDIIAAAQAKWESARAGRKGTTMPRSSKPLMKGWGGNSVRKCEGYSDMAAPVMCLEGPNGSCGSHGMMHGLTERTLKKIDKDLKKYTTVRDALTSTIGKVTGCSKACLAAQLDQYYKKAYCDGKLEDAEIHPHSGKAHGSITDGDL